MNKTAKKTIIGFLIVMLFFGFVLVSLLMSRADPKGSAVLVEIPAGTGSAKMARILVNKGIIKSYYSFRVASRLLLLDQRLKAGSYVLSPRQTLLDILIKLKTGKTSWQPVRVTFPEGSSIYKMGEILKKSGVPFARRWQELTKSDLKNYLPEFAFLKSIPNQSLEGYLYPDTYIFSKDISAEALARLMLDRFAEIVLPFWIEKGALKTDLNLHQAITLASIIEKEARLDEERAVISSIFYNRLKKGMPLSSCSTVKYALDHPTKKVYYFQLGIKSPFNTYMNLGLPPGPICNPGIKSIRAAVYPAQTDYYYFVARKDGRHIFSRNAAEHERATRSVR